MNNQDIDSLSGRELDMAVARELGWRWMDCVSRRNIEFMVFVEADQQQKMINRFNASYHVGDVERNSDDCYPYSTDIAAAWELDGEGWEWSSDDAVLHEADGNIMEVSVYIGQKSYNGLVKWSTMSEKAAAYATARCRAWLKAKYTEKGEQC